MNKILQYDLYPLCCIQNLFSISCFFFCQFYILFWYICFITLTFVFCFWQDTNINLFGRSCNHIHTSYLVGTYPYFSFGLEIPNFLNLAYTNMMTTWDWRAKDTTSPMAHDWKNNCICHGGKPSLFAATIAPSQEY